MIRNLLFIKKFKYLVQEVANKKFGLFLAFSVLQSSHLEQPLTKKHVSCAAAQPTLLYSRSATPYKKKNLPDGVITADASVVLSLFKAATSTLDLQFPVSVLTLFPCLPPTHLFRAEAEKKTRLLCFAIDQNNR